MLEPQNIREIDSKSVTIAELLREAGYTTAHFGKWHINGGGPEANGYDVSDGNIVKQGLAVYVWHCDSQGRYSLYSSGVTSQNYLRGVQVTNDSGAVTFTSVFPGCYLGRWPHVHFEVYPGVEAITDSTNNICTSQVAMPQNICDAVYALDSYPDSARNLGQVTLTTDNVFGDDGGIHQLATVSGDTSGYSVKLTVPVDTATAVTAGSAPGGPGGGAPGARPS